MAKCQLTGKQRLVGNNVSHANNKTKRVQKANIQWKRLWVPEEGKFVRLQVSARAMRSVTRMGLYAFIKKKGLRYKDFGLVGPAN